MKRIFAFALVILLLGPIKLADAASYSRVFEMISELNDSDPLQDPGYERSADVLDRRVLDSKNKVVGEVKDIILGSNGNISSLNVDFNRLRLGQQVYLNYRDMRIGTRNNGYELGIEDDQIEAMYPELLANIETAAGAENTYSVRKIIGANLKDEKGNNIGKVQDVLFDSRGKRAVALFVSMKLLSAGNRGMAVPFGTAKYDHFPKDRSIVVSDAQAKAMKDYAASR